jgi:hypothetical protein
MSSIRSSRGGRSAGDFDGEARLRAGRGRVETNLDGSSLGSSLGSSFGLGDLFAPLDHLLLSGGDARLAVDPASGLNQYGCRALPSDGMTGFSSSTATPISQRAFARAGLAREALMQAAIADGLDHAFDARMEALREELKAHLGLRQPSIDVVFSASGTDAQLQALFLARTLLGPALTTIIVAADQTGSGTAFTSRGLHFGNSTSNGIQVRKAEPICLLAGAIPCISLPLRNDHGDIHSRPDYDRLVIEAAERAIAAGNNVLLQVMDSSKLGWRLPGDQCVLDLATRWPGRVQVVVDACQMRSSRKRIAAYLDRGYLVLLTGSKFFGGPPFSGALLVPAAVGNAIDVTAPVIPQLCDYCTRGDWPMRWPALRAQFSSRPNFGPWLRWEAALEEMRVYYAVPESFRRTALATLGQGIARLIATSPSLRLLPPPQGPIDPDLDNDEMLLPTIFPFTIEQDGRSVSLDRAKAAQRALAGDIRNSMAAEDPDIAAQSCLIGQPVDWLAPDGRSVAALRTCISARHVTECWSAGGETARRNLHRVLDRVTTVIEKLDAPSYHHDSRPQEFSHAH